MFRISVRHLLSTLLLLHVSHTAWANPSTGSGHGPSAAKALERQVQTMRLANGMRWFFVRRPGAPVFTGVVQVKVGGMEEVPGKTGLAHMFEHMAFKGGREIGTTNFPKESEALAQIRTAEAALATAYREEGRDEIRQREQALDQVTRDARAYVIPNEIWHLFNKNGAAELNATTNKDVTTYYARMPANMVGLWTFLTSEMVGFPVLREFYQERSVVMEERRSSVDTNPRGRLYELLVRTAFTRGPYQWMTIGSMADLLSLQLQDAEALHAAYYRPDRMVGAIVGNFDMGQARQMVQQFFGRLPAAPSPPLIERTGRDRNGGSVAEPEQREERRVQVRFDAEPHLMIAYHKPKPPHPDDDVFDLITSVLCDGVTSRLEKRLVETTRVARDVNCDGSSPGFRLDNLFIIDIQPMAGHSLESITALVETELQRLREEPVPAAELTKALTNIEADFLWGISTNEGLAQQLAYFETILGDWRYLVRLQDRLRAVTAADIQRVARIYLVPTKRTVAELVGR